MNNRSPRSLSAALAACLVICGCTTRATYEPGISGTTAATGAPPAATTSVETTAAEPVTEPAAGEVAEETAAAAVTTAAAATEAVAAEPAAATDTIRIVLHTARGDIEAEIYAAQVPMTAANFLNLAARGFYDGLTFHRVISDFMIQGGDPQGTGYGGPGYSFADEFDPALKHDGPGVFSMANSGPDSNGSQFFITHKATAWLDGRHAVFGRVTKGQDVVDAITQGDAIRSIDILDPTDALFAAEAEKLAEWNAVLDRGGY